MIRRTPIEIEVGAKVRYLGNQISRPRDGSELKPGALGVVVEVKPPDHGTGIYFDEIEDIDRGSNGYAKVEFEGWQGRHLIHPEDEGTRWKRDEKR